MKTHLSVHFLCALLVLTASSIRVHAGNLEMTSMTFPEPKLFAQTKLYRHLALPMYLTLQDPNDAAHKNGMDCSPLACYITGDRPFVFFVLANLGPQPDRFRAVRFEVLDLAGKVLGTLNCEMNVTFPSAEINNYNIRWDALSMLPPGQYTLRTTVNPTARPISGEIATSCSYGFTVWSKDRSAPQVDYSRYRMIPQSKINEIVEKYGRTLLGSVLVYNEFRAANLSNPPPPTAELPLNPRTYDIDWDALVNLYNQNRSPGNPTAAPAAAPGQTQTAAPRPRSGNGNFVDTQRLWKEAYFEAREKFPDVAPWGSTEDANNVSRRMQERFRIFLEKFDREAPPEQKAMVNQNIQQFMANGGVQQWKQQRQQNSTLFCPRTGSDGAPHGYYSVGTGCPKCKGEVNYTPRYRGTGANTIVAPPATGHANGFTDQLLID